MLDRIRRELEVNDGKLSKTFMDSVLWDKNTKVTHVHPTPNTRICIITLPCGHDLVGFASVLYAKNDDPNVGKSVAYHRAAEQIWSVYGSIAKVLMEDKK